jgi:hypothetical protein
VRGVLGLEADLEALTGGEHAGAVGFLEGAGDDGVSSGGLGCGELGAGLGGGVGRGLELLGQGVELLGGVGRGHGWCSYRVRSGNVARSKASHAASVAAARAATVGAGCPGWGSGIGADMRETVAGLSSR